MIVIMILIIIIITIIITSVIKRVKEEGEWLTRCQWRQRTDQRSSSSSNHTKKSRDPSVNGCCFCCFHASFTHHAMRDDDDDDCVVREREAKRTRERKKERNRLGDKNGRIFFVLFFWTISRLRFFGYSNLTSKNNIKLFKIQFKRKKTLMFYTFVQISKLKY